VIALDGVFAPDAQGTLSFHPLPHLDSSDVADLLQVIRVRVLRFLERRGVIECSDSPALVLLDDDFAQREPSAHCPRRPVNSFTTLPVAATGTGGVVAVASR